MDKERLDGYGRTALDVADEENMMTDIVPHLAQAAHEIVRLLTD